MIVVTQTYESHSYSLFIDDCDDKFDYAYYLYNNGKRINVIMYSLNKDFHFNTNNMHGFLQIRVFLRDKKTGEKEAFFLKPIKITRTKTLIRDVQLLDYMNEDIVVDNGVEIPIVLKKKQNVEKLFVFLNGAISINTQERLYPYFSRISWSDKFNGHCLYLYDISLNMAENYTLGWYRGGEHPINDKYVELIERFSKLLNIENKNIFFYGSSGGGFAALKFSESFLGSTAIAINPQINCNNYAYKPAVDKFKSVFREHNNLQQIQIDHTKFKAGGSRMILVQNTQDKSHYEKHFKPFWHHFNKEGILISEDRWNTAILFDHDSGHDGAEPPEIFDQIMKMI